MQNSAAKKNLLSSLLLAGVIQPAMAGSFISQEAISATVWNPCTEENVLLEGSMLLRGNTLENASGVGAGNYTENAKNIKATGLSSGDPYTYLHNVVISTHRQSDGQLKIQHLNMDVALLAQGNSAKASDFVIKEFDMHYVFANDGSAVTSNIDYSQGVCE